MPAILTIRDESLTGTPTREWMLEVLTERLTVRELIRSRVYQEVQDHNLRRGERFQGLVEPAAVERELNDTKPRTFHPIDWHRQFERAVEAFDKNQIIVLVNDKQAESLDEEFAVGPETTVTFLRLTMLVGG